MMLKIQIEEDMATGAMKITMEKTVSNQIAVINQDWPKLIADEVREVLTNLSKIQAGGAHAHG